MDVPVECPVCHWAYEPKPGFYHEAMYISSGFSTGILLGTGFLLNYFANDPLLRVYVVIVAAAVLAVGPLLFRYSRAVMLFGFGGALLGSRALPH